MDPQITSPSLLSGQSRLAKAALLDSQNHAIVLWQMTQPQPMWPVPALDFFVLPHNYS